MNLHSIAPQRTRVEELRDWLDEHNAGHTFRTQGEHIFAKFRNDPEFPLTGLDYWYTRMAQDKARP